MSTKVIRNFVFAILAIISTATMGCSQHTREYISFEGESLGTFVQIKANTDIPAKHIAEVVAEVDSIAKGSMSIFNPESLLSKINRNETAVADDHIIRNIELAKRFSQLSDGAYDITIKPLTEADGFGRSVADKSINIDSILEFVGYEKLSLADGLVVKSDERVQIDLNSIAKGYTVDLMAERLEAMGIVEYMVNIGGEIRCRGRNPRGESWRVGIETPYDGNMAMDSFEKIVKLEDCAVATSGNYRRFYLTEDGRKVTHTIDPRTGESVAGDLLSATVIAPTCAEADAAATMFMSLGSEGNATTLAERCAEEYGWRYYFIFAGEEDYRIECSPEFR
ncbi:MAG: FAD:protein FMN transferase [Alistipes sp.]|nr:FAD:protein FMN transferase [Alistipes sp.]